MLDFSGLPCILFLRFCVPVESVDENKSSNASRHSILLEDKNDKGKITARILVRKESLLDWIDIIQSGSQQA